MFGTRSIVGYYIVSHNLTIIQYTLRILTQWDSLEIEWGLRNLSIQSRDLRISLFDFKHMQARFYQPDYEQNVHVNYFKNYCIARKFGEN